MKWTRGEELGRGDSAFVSKATTHQESAGGDVPSVIAVKTAEAKDYEPLFKDKELLNMFKECLFIIRCYGHEFTVENIKEEKTKLYNIFLEYASGGCLLDRMVENKGMPENLVRKYTRSILVALDYIHKHGCVHCDVKPGNILLVREEGDLAGEEIAKLADFGLAKRIMNYDEPNRNDASVGTPKYVAPESVLSKEYGPKSDIWSLGITVLLLLTGESAPQLDQYSYHLHFLKQINSRNKISSKLSKDAKDFLRKCLVTNPRERFSAEALLQHPFLIEQKTSSSRFHLMKPTHCFHFPNRMVHAS